MLFRSRSPRPVRVHRQYLPLRAGRLLLQRPTADRQGHLYAFGQVRNAWHRWTGEAWERCDTPTITARHFSGTGTRFLEDNGRQAIADLFAKSFGK